VSSQAVSRLTFVGHSTVLIEAGGARLLTDPLLRGGLLGLLRRRHPPVDPDSLGRIDAILISHAHHDHLDPRSLRSLPGVPLVVPRGSAALLRRERREVSELAPGESLEIAGVEINAVPAAHPGRRMGSGRPSDALGYLVEANPRVYFAGDTDLFEEMGSMGEGLDAALLPVSGWGPRLGPWHLNPRTAAEALRLLRPRVAVPIHWGTYTPIGAPRLWPWLHTDPPHRFAEHARRIAPETEVRVLAPGERTELEPRG